VEKEEQKRLLKHQSSKQNKKGKAAALYFLVFKMGPGISVLCVCYRSKLYTRPASQPKTKRKRENFFNMEGLFFVLFFLGEYNNDLLEEDDDSRKLLGKLEAINWHTHTHTHSGRDGRRPTGKKKKKTKMRKTVTVFSCKWEELGNAKKKRSLFNEVLQSISNASVNEKTADAKKETHREKDQKREKKSIFGKRFLHNSFILFFSSPRHFHPDALSMCRRIFFNGSFKAKRKKRERKKSGGGYYTS
jgi:hypothetical protein